MKFSGKMCFKIILKVTKKQDFNLSLQDTFFEKPQGGVKLNPRPSCFMVNNMQINFKNMIYEKLNLNALNNSNRIFLCASPTVADDNRRTNENLIQETRNHMTIPATMKFQSIMITTQNE